MAMKILAMTPIDGSDDEDDVADQTDGGHSSGSNQPNSR